MHSNHRNAARPLLLLCLLATVHSAGAQMATPTGGPLRFEQAVYDVHWYDVTLNVDPTMQSITGTTVMVARAVIPTNVVLADLDSPYSVSKVTDGEGRNLRYVRGKDTIRIWFPQTKQPGAEIKTSITYAGKPRVAPTPPWIGGFMWKKTADGSPWVSVALQMDGADLLFPVKDHPSDKAAVASMHITVPDPLVAVGPGKLERVVKNGNGTSTYHWRMGEAIPNYSIVFNAAPYKLIEDQATSITGETIPIKFYILPENQSKGATLIAETKKYLVFFEKYLGPFPFRSQKLGIVETPHLGMEHSTAIAYGNQFRYDADGFDWLMLHELGHEWWANLVTASDWKDFWIHEGFQSYMDVLYVEHVKGKAAYLQQMKARASGTNNRQAVAPREAKFAHEMYFANGTEQSDGDIYNKGALILHSLRHVVGDAAFFQALRHMAYPTKEMEVRKDGQHQRLVTTDDFLTIAEKDSGMELDWFFDLYLRQPQLPKLVSTVTGKSLNLRWETPANLPFPMPVEVMVDGKLKRIAMPGGKATIAFAGAVPVIDPNGWLLKAKQSID